MTEEPRATPLVARHEALGARLVDFAGWRMPIQYAGILEEHRAVRQRAGLFDLCHMGELFVEGPDAGDALAGVVTTDPRSLAIGRAHYSMICDPDGGILDDLIVYRLAEDRFLVVANASNAVVVSDALAERFEGRRAILDDRSLATALVAIQGPAALGILAPLTDLDLEAIRYYGIAEGSVAGVPAPGRAHGLHRRGRLRGLRRRRRRDDDLGRADRSGGAAPALRPWAWAPATRCASRPACRSTATSSTGRRRPSRRGSAGS